MPTHGGFTIATKWHHFTSQSIVKTLMTQGTRYNNLHIRDRNTVIIPTQIYTFSFDMLSSWLDCAYMLWKSSMKVILLEILHNMSFSWVLLLTRHALIQGDLTAYVTNLMHFKSQLTWTHGTQMHFKWGSRVNRHSHFFAAGFTQIFGRHFFGSWKIFAGFF